MKAYEYRLLAAPSAAYYLRVCAGRKGRYEALRRQNGTVMGCAGVCIQVTTPVALKTTGEPLSPVEDAVTVLVPTVGPSVRVTDAWP